jgi:hypothetical protein
MTITSNVIIRFCEFISGMKIKAIALFPFIIISKSTLADSVLLNHERIHLRQQLELLIIPFYIWYIIAFFRKGYLNISFEKEAYLNEKNFNYLKNRKIFAFRHYV